MSKQHFAVMAKMAGIHIVGVPNPQFQLPNIAGNYELAMDAQPELVTQSNAGIPAYLSTVWDPEVIRVLVTPMKAAEFARSETKVGDWLMDATSFPMAEATGEVSSYGDYSNEGRANSNVNWEFRQSYTYQVFTKWGERELERYGLARIAYANEQTNASILALNKFQNKSYWFGVKGLKLYGILNDPALPTPIAPGSDSGQTSWATKSANGIYEDILAIFSDLQSRLNGLIDMASPLILGISPSAEVHLAKLSPYNVSVRRMLTENFPNLTIINAPEFSTPAGELAMMYVETLDGQRTMQVSFTEKLRAHAVVIESSSFKQKKSQGTWGAIIKRPIAVSQMIGF